MRGRKPGRFLDKTFPPTSTTNILYFVMILSMAFKRREERKRIAAVIINS